jgi:hypothetical protein
MQKQIVRNYTFNHTTGAITLTDFSAGYPIVLNRVYLITNVTVNKILYNFANPVVQAVVTSNNVLTLSSVPAGTADTDKLQIIYDVDAGDPIFEAHNDRASAVFTSPINTQQTGTLTNPGDIVTLVVPDGTSSTEIVLTVASGTPVGTVVFETSENSGANYFPRVYRGSGILNNLQTQATAFPSEWRGNSAGMNALRVRATAITGGTIGVMLIASTGVGAIFLNAAIPIGDKSVGNVNTTNIPASSSFTGTWEIMTQVASVSLDVVLSQMGILHLQYSQDGATLFTEDTYDLTANVPFYIGLGTGRGQYFRVVVDNTSASTSTCVLDVTYRAVATGVPRLPLGLNLLSDNTLVPVSKVVTAGKSPDGFYPNLTSSGRHAANSTTAPLVAGGVYRGAWLQWQGSYVKLITDLYTDVPGTFYIDFSEVVTPVDGDESSLTDSHSVAYDPSVLTLYRRHTPVQSRWVRHRYINGVAAQSVFLLDAAFATTDPGSLTQGLRILPDKKSMSSVVRNVPAVLNADQLTYQDLPVSPSSGKPTVHVTNFDPQVNLAGQQGGRITQGVVGSNATLAVSSPLTNRVAMAIANLDDNNILYFGHSGSITSTNNSTPIYPHQEKGGMYGAGVPLYVVGPAGATVTTHNQSASSASGTAASPTNLLVSDSSYSAFTASGQTAALTGFTAGTANALTRVRLGLFANKTAGQLTTVTTGTVVTGTSLTGTVATASSVAGDSNMTYLAFIGRHTANTVTGVTGLGLTWSLVTTQANTTARQIDVWVANGTATTGIVTATMSTSNNDISVVPVIGADQTTPIQDNKTGSGNNTLPTTTGLSGTNNGMCLMGVVEGVRTTTAGSGYTRLSETSAGAGGAAEAMSVESKPLVSTATETPTATLSGSTTWAAVAVTITPSVLANSSITLSYKLSSVVGATSGVVTFSSSADAFGYVDITPDRAWVAADIVNVEWDAVLNNTTLTNGNYGFIEIIDTTGTNTRYAVREIAPT